MKHWKDTIFLLEDPPRRRKTNLLVKLWQKMRKISCPEDRRVSSQRFFAFWSFVGIFCVRVLVDRGLIDLLIRSVPLVEMTDANLGTN